MKTLIRLLEHGCAVWSPYTKSNIREVEIIQRTALRWTLNNYSSYDSVTAKQTNFVGGLWSSSESRRSPLQALLFTVLLLYTERKKIVKRTNT